MKYAKDCLGRGEEAGVLKGQKLIYDNELDWADDICIDGCVVDVLDSRQHFVARGFFNARSKLTVRVLTRRAEETIDRDFFARRIRAAWQTRQTLGFSDSCRVVFGESDGLPGLTVDKFADCLSFQIACLGLEQWKETLVEILAEIFAPGAKKRGCCRSRPASTARSRRSSSSGSTTRGCSSASKTGRRPAISSTSRKTAGG